MKLGQVIKRRDQRKARAEAYQAQLDQNQRLIKNTIRVRTDGRNLMSSGDEEELDSNPKKRQKKDHEMRGATVISEPAFLRHKRLLDKKF